MSDKEEIPYTLSIKKSILDARLLQQKLEIFRDKARLFVQQLQTFKDKQSNLVNLKIMNKVNLKI